LKQTSWSELTEEVRSGKPIAKDRALSIVKSSDADLLTILDVSYRVRRHFHGNKVRVHVLRNAKSGACPEDCTYCSQAVQFHSPIERYAMQSAQELVEGGRRAFEMGAVTYCMVTSTRGPSESEIETVCDAVRTIKKETPLSICCSLGILAEGQAERLAEAGVDRYNHNLETSREFFPKVCTTHSYEDRVRTIRAAKTAGMEACSGGIVGMGEAPEDRVELAFALRELDVESVPVNFLDPRPNTPLNNLPRMRPNDCLRTLAMFRLVHPDRDVRAAGGREACLGCLQPLALYAANSIFTNGYLTTPGQEPSSDWKMMTEAGFEPVVVGAKGFA